MNLDQIELPNRIAHALHNSGIYTLEELIKVLPRITSFRNVGEKSKLDLINALREKNLISAETYQQVSTKRNGVIIKKRGKKNLQELTISEIIEELKTKDVLQGYYESAKEICRGLSTSVHIMMAYLRKSDQWELFKQQDQGNVIKNLLRAGGSGLTINRLEKRKIDVRLKAQQPQTTSKHK